MNTRKWIAVPTSERLPKGCYRCGGPRPKNDKGIHCTKCREARATKP